MSAPEVTIVACKTANTASVSAAFRRLGARPKLTDDPAAISTAELLVLPGVGAFDAAVAQLDERGLSPRLARRIESGQATLAICLGMQLFCKSSEESPGTLGLGVVEGQVRRFGSELRTPQLGWNRVQPVDSRLLEAGDAYFANTYRLDEIPAGWGGARSDYGGPFASAIERGSVLACQFHPELSGPWGAELLARWIERGRSRP